MSSVFSYIFALPLTQDDAVALIVFLFMMLFIDSFPLRIQGVNISFGLALSIAVVMRYGIVVEAWMVFASVVVTFLLVRTRRVEHELLIWSMFLCMSWLAGFAYWLAGGSFGAGQNVGDFIVPIFVYAVAAVVVNYLCYLQILRMTLGKARKIKWQEWKWELISSGLSVCLGVLLYIVQEYIGLAGVALLGVPLLAISYILRIYNTMEQTNKQLTSLNELSLSFSSELDVNRTINALDKGIAELVKPDACWILWLDEERELLYPLSVSGPLSDDWRDEWMNLRIPVGEGLSGSVAENGKTAVIHRHAEAYRLFARSATLKSLHSLVAVPMRWHNKTVGVITLGSAKEFVFDRRTITLIEILANQAGVAIDNARRYEASEQASRRDELTGVFNYRAFEHVLENLLAQSSTHDVSLIMIDIDHFKQVNDQYGHLAGNDILRQLAAVLQKHVRGEDIVARYGGEEFAVILPNTRLKAAEKIAERLRETVKSHPFQLADGIGRENDCTVHITLSMGIAHYPEQATDGTSLVRHADRAMYLGSKRQGRNRVAVYQVG